MKIHIGTDAWLAITGVLLFVAGFEVGIATSKWAFRTNKYTAQYSDVISAAASLMCQPEHRGDHLKLIYKPPAHELRAGVSDFAMAVDCTGDVKDQKADK